MVYDETLEEVGHEIKADRGHAQILLRITDSSKFDAEAERIVEDLGIHIIEKSYLSTQWILFKLDVRDMRNAALKLTEHGFVIKGINALPEERISSNRGGDNQKGKKREK
jgi:hypothetical protein